MCGAEAAALDALAERLLGAQGCVHGESLAQDCGCAPAELAPKLAELRALGAPVCESAGGHALVLADPLDASAIRAGLAPASRLDLWVHRVCTSTNEVVRGMAVPALCVAEAQTAGRGRRGTRWMQPFGAGLALSLALPVPRGRLDPLAIVFALAVARSLDGMGCRGIRIKWPNDLYARGAKLGGLVVEADSAPPGRLVVGLGLNVLAAPAVADRATVALVELGPPPSRNRLAARLAEAMFAALERYDAEGFAPFAAEFSDRDELAGQVVELRDLGAVVRGTARGIDAYGALILDTDAGRRLCRAGDVALVSRPGAPWASA